MAASLLDESRSRPNGFSTTSRQRSFRPTRVRPAMTSSKSSGGTALMPARSSTPMKELPRHMLNRVTLRKTQAPVPSALSTAYFNVPMNTL